MRCKLLATILLATASQTALAQADYPNRPIKLVVGFAPGGGADTTARSMSEALSRELGQPVIVDNKPGAGSSIAADAVSKSEPDGYTLLIASPSSILVNPILNPKLRYSTTDLIPISKLTSLPLVLAVNPNLNIKTVQQLIDYAKKEPGKLNYASSGNGSAPHLGGALFALVADIQMQHVPFKGGAPAIQSVVAGDTQLTAGSPASVMPQIKSGRLNALVVSKTDGSKLFPDFPGSAAIGLPEFEIDFWHGLFAPKGTPDAIVQKIFEATQRTMNDPKVVSLLAAAGTEVSVSESPKDFENYLRNNDKFWTHLVKSAGVTAE